MSDRYLPTPVGFARVNREPLDKYEQFGSLRDAILYAESGAAYTGQHLAVVFGGGNDSNYSLYTVNKNRKLSPVVASDSLLSFGLNEITIVESGLLKWILVYYHDTSKVYSSDAIIGNSVFDPFRFSILNELELFRSKNGEFNFLLYKDGVSNRWRQRTNPITMEAVGTGSTDGIIIDGNITKLVRSNSNTAFIKDYNNPGYVDICPKVASSNVIEIYVEATDYLAGGEFS